MRAILCVFLCFLYFCALSRFGRCSSFCIIVVRMNGAAHGEMKKAERKIEKLEKREIGRKKRKLRFPALSLEKLVFFCMLF